MIFSIAMDADYSFYVKTIETYARALNVSAIAPLTPDRCQVERPPPSLQITSNFLVFYGLSHGTTLKKKGVAVF